MNLERIEMIASPHFTRVSGSRKVDLLVIHTAETPESKGSARGVAKYFQTTDRSVSSHYCVDANEVVQCVRLNDVAWCAPGTNHNGIQVELSGRAGQTAAEWADAFSKRQLALTVDLFATLATRYRIPPVALGPAELVGRKRGITTHNAASHAFHGSNHWDPGPGFPMSLFVTRVKAKMGIQPSGSVAPPAEAPLPTLKVGSTGWRVTQLQRALAARGISPGPTDGIFGPATRAAVVKFQTAAGIFADGIVGPLTWSTLLGSKAKVSA